MQIMNKLRVKRDTRPGPGGWIVLTPPDTILAPYRAVAIFMEWSDAIGWASAHAARIHEERDRNISDLIRALGIDTQETQ